MNMDETMTHKTYRAFCSPTIELQIFNSLLMPNKDNKPNVQRPAGLQKTTVSRRSFLFDWAEKDAKLTSYNMHPMVIRYGKIFYGGVDERKYINNLVANLNRLVKEGVLRKPVCIGLGQGAKNDFFGTKRQYYWHVSEAWRSSLNGG